MSSFFSKELNTEDFFGFFRDLRWALRARGFIIGGVAKVSVNANAKGCFEGAALTEECVSFGPRITV